MNFTVTVMCDCYEEAERFKKDFKIHLAISDECGMLVPYPINHIEINWEVEE
jgi:hypothetical protein